LRFKKNGRQFSYKDSPQGQVKRLRRQLGLGVLLHFRPGIIKPTKGYKNLNTYGRFKNYFKVALRDILKRKMYSFINAFGLSIGIAFCILIYLFIRDEKSFDQFHANKNQIYRMEAKSDPKNSSGRDAALQHGVRNVLKEEVPQIKYATRFNSGRTVGLATDLPF
jgi:putative ABC transport system permease protein